jgi:hypothetical protein
MLSKNKPVNRTVPVLPWEIISTPGTHVPEPRLLAAQSFVYRLIVALSDLRHARFGAEKERRAKKDSRATKVQI